MRLRQGHTLQYSNAVCLAFSVLPKATSTVKLTYVAASACDVRQTCCWLLLRIVSGTLCCAATQSMDTMSEMQQAKQATQQAKHQR